MFVNNTRSAVSQIKDRNKIFIWGLNIIHWVSYICNVYTEWTGKCDWVCTQVKTDKSCVCIGIWQNVYSVLTLDAWKTPLSQLLLLGSVTQLCLHLGDYRNTGFWISSASLPFLSCRLLSVPLSICSLSAWPGPRFHHWPCFPGRGEPCNRGWVWWHSERTLFFMDSFGPRQLVWKIWAWYFLHISWYNVYKVLVQVNS